MYLIKHNDAINSCEYVEVLWNLDFIQDKIWLTEIKNIGDLHRRLETGKKIKIADITIWKHILKMQRSENTNADG